MSEPLAGKRILVVEDEYYIAADLKRALSAAGAVLAGPVSNVGDALSLLDDRLDAAILDVNLGGTLTYALADELAARRIPVMFATGYDDWAVPDAYRAVPRITKPFPISAMLAKVEQLIVAPPVAA